MKIFDLQDILKIKKIHNLDYDEVINYFRIVKYNDDKDASGNVIYFPITITKKDVESGWYIQELDYKKRINEIALKNPHYIYVIEEDMIENINDKIKYIVVDNIMESIDRLFEYKLSKYNGKIITITGSVGKTTTAGFIEQVLGEKCGRIYSKRITPLILKTYMINYLSNDLEYIVLEASLWYKEHMSYFSEVLKPDLAILMNVYFEHIGVKDIKDISDITKFKSLLLEHAKNAMINKTDKELVKININNHKVYYENQEICNTEVNHIIDVQKINDKIEPYIKTELSLLQETIAYEVGKFYGINDEIIYDRLSKVKPVENRIQKYKLYNHDIIFDGDVSGVSRLNNLCNNFYDKCYFVICSLTEGGEETENYEKISVNFDKFSKVYVQEKYKKYYNNDKNVVYFKNLDFIEELEFDYIIIMHYGSYYRLFDKFQIENLEVKS